MSGRIIVFEGVDGSGKTEVGRRTAKCLGANFIDSPLPEFQQVRKYVNGHTPTIGQFLFYLSTNLDLSRYMQESREENDIVCTRYYHSSLVDYSTRLGLEYEELMAQLPISHDDFIQPDLTFLLYVNEQEQQKRINLRNRGKNSHSDSLCLEDTAYRKKITEQYLNMSDKLNWQTIDTSNTGIGGVVMKALQYIEKLAPNGG